MRDKHTCNQNMKTAEIKVMTQANRNITLSLHGSLCALQDYALSSEHNERVAAFSNIACLFVAYFQIHLYIRRK